MPPHLAAALPADARKDTVAPTSKAWHAAAIAVAIATTAIAGTERQRAEERMSTICSWSTNAKNEPSMASLSMVRPRGHIYFFFQKTQLDYSGSGQLLRDQIEAASDYYHRRAILDRRQHSSSSRLCRWNLICREIDIAP